MSKPIPNLIRLYFYTRALLMPLYYCVLGWGRREGGLRLCVCTEKTKETVRSSTLSFSTSFSGDRTFSLSQVVFPSLSPQRGGDRRVNGYALLCTWVMGPELRASYLTLLTNRSSPPPWPGILPSLRSLDPLP